MKRILTIGTSILALVVASAAHADPSWNFGVTDSIETFVVPTTGTYDITVVGAQGTGAGANTGGFGAAISARIALTAGENVSIAVGEYYPADYGYTSLALQGGGGGGSFVVAPGNQPLLIAGGGGGASSFKGGYNASLTRTANQGNGLGQGGATLSDLKSGGGGGGFFSGGGTAKTRFGWSFDGNSWSLGVAGVNPAFYGLSCCGGGAGGFGGGGGGTYIPYRQGYGLGGGGGGGGYSGGNGGLASRFYNNGLGTGGGGGGSYIPTGATVLSAGLNSAGGNGYVTITQDQATSTDVPEPASAALLGLGAAALAAQRRRKR